MVKKKLAHEKDIIETLRRYYTVNFFATEHERNPYKVLISCLISLRTKDEVTYPASKRLFALADTPEKMMALEIWAIEKAIFPAGFYRTKAKRIKEISRVLFEDNHSVVPDSIEELMKLKGVGRKTANIVMVFAYGKNAIPVDTHVHKLSNRLGWVRTKSPEDTEQALRKSLDPRYWLIVNELFVRHGQKICLSVSPFCSRCMISRYCKRIGVGRSR